MIAKETMLWSSFKFTLTILIILLCKETYREQCGPSYSKLGEDDPGLERNLNSDQIWKLKSKFSLIPFCLQYDDEIDDL